MRGNSMRPFVLPDNFEFKEGSLSHIERCFILGNGPTLNKFILDNLYEEFTIGVNRILYSGFQPTIVGATDPKGITEDLIQYMNNSKSKLVFAEHYAKAAIEKGLNKSKVSKTFKINFTSKYGDVYLNLYNHDFSMTTAALNVVADCAIPLAMYLGIKNIFLLGMDEFWNIHNTSNRYFSENIPSLVEAFSWARDMKMRDVIFSKIDFLAGMNGYKIINLSPGSAIKGFEKKDAHDLFPDIINHQIKISEGKFLQFNNELYKITKSNNGIQNSYSFKNIKTGLFIRHISGNVIDSGNDINPTFFNADSSFYIESSFVDINKVSLRSTNIKNAYIVKEPYSNKYVIRKFNNDFIASESSFEIFS